MKCYNVPGRESVSHLAPSSQVSSSHKLPDAEQGKEGRCGHHPITAPQAQGSELMSGLHVVTGACGTAEGEGRGPAAGTDKAKGGRCSGRAGLSGQGLTEAGGSRGRPV